ncbi:MAG: hypothetical protein JW881_10980 [Spirochaetales bacterium]|nr:hypothetical protein [Spirochaetales bacterium]
MNEHDITLSAQTLRDDVLYNIARAAMDRDYKAIVEWLVEYCYGSPVEWDRFELEAKHLSRQLGPMIKDFKKKLRWSMLEEGDELFTGTIKKLLMGFRSDNRKIVDRIIDLRSVFENLCDTMKVRNESDLKNVLRYLEELSEYCVSLRGAECYGDSVTEYEKALTDHRFLIGQLINVFTFEYDNKVKAAKKRFQATLLLHEKDVDNIARELGIVRGKIDNLKNDTVLSEKDRRAFRAAFEEKRISLTKLHETAKNRISGINAVIKEVIESYETIRTFIASLEERLASFDAREQYLSSLADVGKKIPGLEAKMETLFEDTEMDIKDLTRSIIIFNGTLQDNIIRAIDEQGTINRILFSDRDAVTEEINLLRHGE